MQFDKNEEDIPFLANLTGRVLQAQPQSVRFRAIRELIHLDRLFDCLTEERLTRLLLRLENDNKANKPKPNEDNPIPDYGTSFEAYIRSLPPSYREIALKKLTEIVSYFTGSSINDFVELML